VLHGHSIRDSALTRTLQEYSPAGQEIEKNPREGNNIACTIESFVVALRSAN
jgi:hypothetical protein